MEQVWKERWFWKRIVADRKEGAIDGSSAICSKTNRIMDLKKRKKKIIIAVAGETVLLPTKIIQNSNHGTCCGRRFHRRHYYIAVLHSNLIGLLLPTRVEELRNLRFLFTSVTTICYTLFWVQK